MLATRTTTGLSGAGHPHARGRAGRAAMRRTTIACSSRSLRRAQQPLAEVVVDGRVGAAARRAGQRERRGPQALAADQQLGAGGDERAVAAADAEDVAGREGLAQDAEDRGRVVVAPARAPATSRASTIFSSSPRADALDAARDRALVVLGRHRAVDRGRARPGRDPAAAARRRVERRQARLQPRERRASASSPARTSAATVSRTSPPRRASATSGTCSDAGAKPRQCARAPPSSREREAADGDEAAARAGRRARRSTPLRGQRAPAARDRGEALRARAPRAPSRSRGAARAAPSRSGCSRQNHGSPAARRAATTTARRVDASADDAAPSPRRRHALAVAVARAARPPRRAARAGGRAAALVELERGGPLPQGCRAPGAALRSRPARARSRSRPCASSR